MTRFNQLFIAALAAFGVSGALAPLEPTPIELSARRLPAPRVWGAAYYSPHPATLTKRQRRKLAKGRDVLSGKRKTWRSKY